MDLWAIQRALNGLPSAMNSTTSNFSGHLASQFHLLLHWILKSGQPIHYIAAATQPASAVRAKFAKDITVGFVSTPLGVTSPNGPT